MNWIELHGKVYEVPEDSENCFSGSNLFVTPGVTIAYITPNSSDFVKVPDNAKIIPPYRSEQIQDALKESEIIKSDFSVELYEFDTKIWFPNTIETHYNGFPQIIENRPYLVDSDNNEFVFKLVELEKEINDEKYAIIEKYGEGGDVVSHDYLNGLIKTGNIHQLNILNKDEYGISYMPEFYR